VKKNSLIILIIILLLMIACEKQPQNQPATAPASPQSQAMKNITSKPEVSFQTISAKLASMPRYNFYGMKDPFYTPIIQTQVKQVKPKKQRVAPTEKYEIEKYNLIGILVNKKVKSAIFEDPEGKGWVVKEGAPIGQEDAKIKKITSDGVYIEEIVVDERGKEKKSERFIPIKKSR